MPRYYNEYSPQTGIGQGLNNAVASLFSGKGPKDEALNSAHMAAYRASADASRAHAAKLQTEADSERAGLDARSNFLETALKLIPGIDTEGLGGAMSYLNTGATPREAYTADGDVGPTGVREAPWFTPGTRRNVDTTSQLASLLMAGKPSTVDDLAKARLALQGGVEQAGVLDSSVDPTKFFQSRTKPVSGVDEGYAVNLADPLVPPRELGIASALIEQRGAQANKDEAAAELDAEKMNTEQARQGNLRASAKRAGTSTKLVPVIDDNGDTLWMPADQASGEKVGGKPSTAKPATRKPLTKSQNEQMAAAIGARESELDASLDANAKARVTSKATQLASDPDGEFFQDPAGAVSAAFEEVGELDVSGRWNPFKSNVATMKKQPAQTTVRAKPDAAKAPPTGKPLDAPETEAQLRQKAATLEQEAAAHTRNAAAAGDQATRAAKNQQLLDEANEAIGKGADPEKVKARLKELGYSGSYVQ